MHTHIHGCSCCLETFFGIDVGLCTFKLECISEKKQKKTPEGTVAITFLRFALRNQLTSHVTHSATLIFLPFKRRNVFSFGQSCDGSVELHRLNSAVSYGAAAEAAAVDR